ncbi:MAG: asparagine synthetase B [Candidatus Marinimicrobia bacterium]|nr:asparagine synthetase B [Candidatus Neomarinimicrobiota bacterium]
MDENQNNHLKSYGIAFWVLENNETVDWLLNYRGGSFVVENYSNIKKQCLIRGVSYEEISEADYNGILNVIENNNMDVMLLEKEPKIAVYTPPNKMPWDDAVTMALTYAEIPYEKIYDTKIVQGKLNDYDWLHLHHEDFTGQYGKFYRNYRHTNWYKNDKKMQETLATSLGFNKVSKLKLAVALRIKEYVANGGFMFAMCAATDTYEIALSAQKLDIVPSVFDGDGIDNNIHNKLDFSQTFAFENFNLNLNPLIYEFSDIDFPPSNLPLALNPSKDYFSLFEFSAKFDPVPTMLTQNHRSIIKGFMGQTTGFNRQIIKKHVLILGEVKNGDMVKYIHGNFGKGTFTYYGGHDPADYKHFVGDPPTNLELHKNNPGYRLILNNVLFPAAKKQKRKT